MSSSLSPMVSIAAMAGPLRKSVTKRGPTPQALMSKAGCAGRRIGAQGDEESCGRSLERQGYEMEGRTGGGEGTAAAEVGVEGNDSMKESISAATSSESS